MPRSATDRESFGRSYSSEDFQLFSSVSPGGTVMSTGGHGGSLGSRTGPRQWSVTVLSVLFSAVAVAAVGCCCAFIYPILKELRGERVRGEDGTEQRMLGFWSISVLSVSVGCICYGFSWTLTCIDSHQEGVESTKQLSTSSELRDMSTHHNFHLSHGVAVLNGIMAMLTVIWSLT